MISPEVFYERKTSKIGCYSRDYLDKKFTEIENKIFEICKTLDEDIIPFIEKLKQEES